MKRDLVKIDGKDRTDEIKSWKKRGDYVFITFKNNNKEYQYKKEKISFVKTALSNDKAYQVFQYLKNIAYNVGFINDKENEKGNNSLYKSYDELSFISKDTILSSYLNETKPCSYKKSEQQYIFPFGFNLSQKDALYKAFSGQLSVIEGPPGTGKTQTILNIIANSIMNDTSVAVVSANNAATKNVYDKLNKNGFGFIVAQLGSIENKEKFINEQIETPDLSEYLIYAKNKKQIKKKASSLFDKLTKILFHNDEYAVLKRELDNIKTEYKHFIKSHISDWEPPNHFKFTMNSHKSLSFWLALETQFAKKSKIGFIRRLIYRIKFGIKEKSFYNLPNDQMILAIQKHYYQTKIDEMEARRNAIADALSEFSLKNKMEDYESYSIQLFKAKLYEKYASHEQSKYSNETMWNNSSQFIKDYPVILSTTHSLRRCFGDKILYDYLIIDEASQVDLATGALAMSCAKNAVIVGDLKQLPNIVNKKQKADTDKIFNDYSLNEGYRYSKHSLLSSILDIYQNIPRTLLKEHYRCHPMIIEFCNRKFYNNQLIIHSDIESDRQPLIVYKTNMGNHERDRMNQRQIDIIEKEIFPLQNLDNTDFAIISPYRNQTNAISNEFKDRNIEVDTVNKFQGREKDIVILSTVDNQIKEFTDDPRRLNVAVSRAIKQLILIVHGNKMNKASNIADLIGYIDYNNCDIIDSKIRSVFDNLYKGYEKIREGIIQKSSIKFEYDSETLFYSIIEELLSEDGFLNLSVVSHYSLNLLIKDQDMLSIEEHKYATNPQTHLDFLIYNKLNKQALLAIEVDGYSYHQDGTRQSERDKMKNNILEKYKIPYIRFATNGSNEKERLRAKLNCVINSNSQPDRQ